MGASQGEEACTWVAGVLVIKDVMFEEHRGEGKAHSSLLAAIPIFIPGNASGQVPSAGCFSSSKSLGSKFPAKGIQCTPGNPQHTVSSAFF